MSAEYNPVFRVVYAIINKSSPFGSPKGTFKTYKSNPEKLELLKMVVLQLHPTYKLLLRAATLVYIEFSEEVNNPPENVTRYEYSLNEILDCLKQV